MTHTEVCEIAENDLCICECEGRYHGIAKQTQLNQFIQVEGIEK